MPDIINGLFELLGGYFVLLHILTLHTDKEVKGVSWAAVLFFVTWGYWNLYYYPYLGQFISLAGGIVLAITNTVWLLMIVYYKFGKTFVGRFLLRVFPDRSEAAEVAETPRE